MKYLSPKSLFIVVAIITWFFYNGLLLPNYGKFRKDTENFNYFKNLAISFLQGKTNIECPEGTNCLDLIDYNNKWYLYWPPVPSFIYIPFVVIWGDNTPDFAIVAVLGAINVFLVMLIVQLFTMYFKIGLNKWTIALVGMFWGLGTIHFYMSMAASVWFFSQIIGQTFLLLSIFIFLRFLLNPSNLNLILSGIFWGLACYTKNNLIFSFFFIATLFYIHYKKIDLKKGAIFITPFVVFSILNLIYNHVRFGNYLENGVNYHHMGDYFLDNFKKYGYLSKHYIPHNFQVEVISIPPIITKFPYFGFNPEGAGMLWTSPVFLIFIPLLLYYFISLLRSSNISPLSLNDRLMMGVLLLTICFIALLLFSIMGTGYWQFGARYTLDFQLFVLLFILFVFKIIPNSKILTISLLVLLILSIYVNFIGVYYYHNLQNRIGIQ